MREALRKSRISSRLKCLPEDVPSRYVVLLYLRADYRFFFTRKMEDASATTRFRKI